MEEREISLKELILVIWRGKWIIMIAAAIAFVIAAAGAFYMDSKSSSVATVVTMQWTGVGQGEYPDGSRFDYTSAIEPYVITLALDELQITSVSSTEVRDQITFVPLVPADVLAQIEAAIKAGEELSYFATDYRMVMDNGELGISVEDASALMNEIINQFKIDFERRYIHQITVMDFTDSDFSSYDYLDAYDILNSQVEAIETVMELNQESNFYSSDGYTFNDILVRTDLLERIELEQVITRTNNYLLTKDEAYLITNYKYKIEQAEMELAKATAKEAEIEVLVTNYQGNTSTLLIPGLEETEIIVDTYYDTLMETVIALQDTVAELTEDIVYYQLQITRLEGNDEDFNISDEVQAAEIAKVELNISIANDKLIDIVSDSNLLLSEYNEYQTSNIIKPLLAPEYQSNTNILLYSAVGFVLGAGIGLVVVLFRNDWDVING